MMHFGNGDIDNEYLVMHSDGLVPNFFMNRSNVLLCRHMVYIAYVSNLYCVFDRSG